MSDHSISIVPRKSDYQNREIQAKNIVSWLLSRDIIKPVLSNCVLGPGKGYAISDGARLVTSFPDALPLGLVVNGLEIITERQIFDTAENGIESLFCPNCKEDISGEDWSFLNEWADGKSDNLICPQCKQVSEIHNYSFTPDWGFSNIGFIFWNWPELTPEFIEEFKLKLGCEISVVYQHV